MSLKAERSEALTKLLGTRNVYGEVLAELGETHKNIVVLNADLSGSTKTELFHKKFPHRFFNMGIAEQDMIGTAAGLATTGKIPFLSTFSIFAVGKPWEQIRQSIANPGLNVKIVATHGGITVGEDGASHQCIEDIGLMRILPNMTVIVPADGVETGKAVKAILDHSKHSEIIETVIVNDSLPKNLALKYKAADAYPVVLDSEKLKKLGIKVLIKRLIEENNEGLVRHSPERIARIIFEWYKGNGKNKKSLEEKLESIENKILV